MEMEARNSRQENNRDMVMVEDNTSVDWRGKPSNPNKHGGMKAAVFVLGINIYY